MKFNLFKDINLTKCVMVSKKKKYIYIIIITAGINSFINKN